MACSPRKKDGSDRCSSRGDRCAASQTFPTSLPGRAGTPSRRATLSASGQVGSGWAGKGYDGVHIFAPDGERIGQILLPEICSNVCFGGRKRNRLFMTGSQSLYAVYVETQGAHNC